MNEPAYTRLERRSSMAVAVGLVLLAPFLVIGESRLAVAGATALAVLGGAASLTMVFDPGIKGLLASFLLLVGAAAFTLFLPLSPFDIVGMESLLLVALYGNLKIIRRRQKNRSRLAA